MSLEGLLGIRKAIANLNPAHVRELSERPLRVAICAASAEGENTIKRFLLGDLRARRRQESLTFVESCSRALPGGPAPNYDMTIYEWGMPAPPRSLIFRPDVAGPFVTHALKKHPDLGVSLARAFPPFRNPYVAQVISQTCRENTLFSLATALPDIIPNLLELPWAVAEFASDTAFLTANQLKMAFLIAAASDREVGYRQQRSEIGTVVAGAFGWRAIARQLIGKVPFGGGLIAKAAVAYAGTKVVGLSLDHLYSIGYTYSREERDTLYADALRQGQEVAKRILSHLRPDLAARYAAKASGQAVPPPA